MRPDRLQSAMELFASRCLSVKELSPEILNLRRLYEMESLPQEPILVIISAGSDPSQVIVYVLLNAGIVSLQTTIWCVRNFKNWLKKL